MQKAFVALLLRKMLHMHSEAQFKLLQAVGQMREVDFSSYMEIESDQSF